MTTPSDQNVLRPLRVVFTEIDPSPGSGTSLRRALEEAAPSTYPTPLSFRLSEFRQSSRAIRFWDLGRCTRVLSSLSEFCVIADQAKLLEDIEYLNARDAIENDRAPVRVLSPLVAGMSMESPLVVQIITSLAGTGGVGLGAAYLLKHPEAIGSWLPRVRAAWYMGQVEAEKARRLHSDLMEAGMVVEESSEEQPH